MLEQLRENQQLFYEQAIVPLNSGRINHAYLIETNNNEDELVDTYLNEFYKQLLICGLNESNEVGISKEKLINLLENKSYPDLLEIKPENNVIKKEQLLEIMEKFSNKS